MIDQKTVLGVIPARGGSKRIPRKNLQVVSGKPLVAWTIEEARKSKYIDRLILSSEDPEIIMIVQELGCEVPFVRPADLATDEAAGTEPILHALQQLPDYEYVVVLQPTSPLRIVDDIDGCIRKCYKTGSPACVSVAKCTDLPRLLFRMSLDDRITPLVSDELSHVKIGHLPDVYKLNGAVYVALTSWFQTSRTFIDDATLGYEMPVGRSLDIDTEDDLKHFVTHLMKPEWQ